MVTPAGFYYPVGFSANNKGLSSACQLGEDHASDLVVEAYWQTSIQLHSQMPGKLRVRDKYLPIVSISRLIPPSSVQGNSWRPRKQTFI